MRALDLERLYDYSYWANRRLLAALAPLTPDVAANHSSSERRDRIG
jgi:uncharacterized damage-inducible protein DinB